MATRTTPQLVQSIAQDIDPTVDLTGYIQTANIMVTNVCAVAGSPYDAPTLELIERYLAAHLYFVDQQRSMLERVGSAEVQYQQLKGNQGGLGSTQYGQTAKVIDYNLYLAGVENMAGKQLSRQRGVVYLGSRCYPVGPGIDGSCGYPFGAGPYT